MDEQVTAVVVSSSMSYNIILTTNVLYKKNYNNDNSTYRICVFLSKKHGTT